ncbi:MAG: DUF6527 family protein [Candidatus Acidiferrum sp.]
MKLLKQIENVWKKLKRRKRLEKVLWVESRGDLPTRIGAKLYVVGTEIPKWVVLDCPCGCGERIDVNLMAARRPAWEFTAKDGKATLWPSLWMPREKCGSHFWIRKNRIIWV